MFTSSSWSHMITHSFSFTRGMIFLITALIIASLKPYRKDYMNHIDTLLLLDLVLLCVSSNLCFTMIKILLFIPIAAFILTPLLKFIIHKNHNFKFNAYISQKLCAVRALFNTDHEAVQSSTADAPATVQEQQPLIQPTCTEISYGI